MLPPGVFTFKLLSSVSLAEPTTRVLVTSLCQRPRRTKNRATRPTFLGTAPFGADWSMHLCFGGFGEGSYMAGQGRYPLRECAPDPGIEDSRDAIIKVTACAICGSDLHLYDGVMPSMHNGDVLGHETMGEVVEVGSGVQTLRKGDRVVVPFTIAYGRCNRHMPHARCYRNGLLRARWNA
jgi:hypothetical protein